MSSEVTESVGFYEFLAWLEINKKRLIIGGIVLAGLGLAIAIYRWQSNEREVAAYAALLRLGLPMSPADTETAPSASAYLKVADEYARTHAGEQAMLLAAGDLFKSGKYDEARAAFEKFANQYGDSALVPAALLGVAASLDALNRMDEARKAYQDMASRYPASPVAPQAKLALAGLYESQKQPEPALKIYEELMQSATAGGWASEARQRRAELLLQHPNLVKVEAAPAPAPGAPRIQNLLPPALLSAPKGTSNPAAGGAGSRTSATNPPAGKAAKP